MHLLSVQMQIKLSDGSNIQTQMKQIQSFQTIAHYAWFSKLILFQCFLNFTDAL